MAKINFKSVPQGKRRMVYKILQIYRECGYLRVYKEIGPVDKLLEYSEYQLAVHLDRLVRGEPEWMFKFGGEVPTELPEKPIKRILQMALFCMALLLSGCASSNPFAAQWQYEIAIFEKYGPEKGLEILGGGRDRNISSNVLQYSPNFTESFYYKNSIYLQSTYGRRQK